MQTLALDQSDEGRPIEHRHLDVDDEDIGLDLCEQSLALERIVGGLDSVTPSLECVSNDVEHDRAVVDDENSRSGISHGTYRQHALKCARGRAPTPRHAIEEVRRATPPYLRSLARRRPISRARALPNIAWP